MLLIPNIPIFEIQFAWLAVSQQWQFLVYNNFFSNHLKNSEANLGVAYSLEIVDFFRL